jgi:hypothetical protein
MQAETDNVLYEHLLVGFAKQALCGLCSNPDTSMATPSEVADLAFELADQCVKKFEQRRKAR